MKKLAVLISNAGTGTNLQAIIETIGKKLLQAKISIVISDTADAYGLIRAKKHHLPTLILKKTDDLTKLLKEEYQVDYVCLAGWKKIIPEPMIEVYKNKILNIHPGLIPDKITGFVKNPDNTKALWNRGKFTNKAIQNFFDHKATYAGSTVHFLSKKFDFGKVLEYCFEKILPKDTVDSLYSRLKKQEHQIYIKALIKLCNQEKKYALISVFDKTGIVDFAKTIKLLNYQIISTGGTAKVLKENNIPAIPVEKITGMPECFDGRMKTISFQVAGGILFDRDNQKHVKEAQKLKIKSIDLVICNLYPFEKTISDKNVSLKTAVENIDIGGPTMIRAAAKNFKHVLIICDPKDYPETIPLLRKGKIKQDVRKKLATKAFGHVSFYDSQIAKFLNKELFPQEITLPGRKITDLRYGENPHQKAAFYLQPNTTSPLKDLKKHWGRDLSLVNLTDINAGLESIRFFQEPAAVVIKHNSPCGIALGKNSQQALDRAIAADPQSAFGGVIVINKKVDLKCAQIISRFKNSLKSNIDILAAPEISPDAFKLLISVRKSMGIYTFGKIVFSKRLNIKWLDGGFILQESDDQIKKQFKSWTVVSKIKPTKLELKQMQTAWFFISRIRSNTILVMDKKIPMTRGIGSGQTSRIRSAEIALTQAGKFAKGALLASDSFFPFSDTVKLASKCGIKTIVQQGGSINDQLSIQAADQAKIAMVFTHYRSFWH